MEEWCLSVGLLRLYARAIIEIAALISGTVLTIEDFGHQTAQTEHRAYAEHNVQYRTQYWNAVERRHQNHGQ